MYNIGLYECRLSFEKQFEKQARCASGFTVTIRTYGFMVSLRVYRWAIEDVWRSEVDDRSWIRSKERHTSRVERSVSMTGSQPSTRSRRFLPPLLRMSCRDYLYKEPWNLDKPVLLQSLTSPAIGDVHLRLLSAHHSCGLNLTPNSLILSPFPMKNDLSLFPKTFHSAIAAENFDRCK